MEIKTTDYSIHYDSATATAICQGSLRLNGTEEYAPIANLLHALANQASSVIILDLQELEFLNSSGINVLAKFTIEVRQKGNIEMTIRGSKSIPWQGKSLKNLQRLMPSLNLEFE